MTDSLRQLSDEGVAIWLDDMSRGRLVTDNLADLVRRNIVSPAEARGKAKFPENFPG